MGKKHGWLVVLVTLALLVAACGPEMATSTPGDSATAEKPAATATQPEQVSTSAPASADASELPVDPDDWHALGSPDAPVTIVEYSEFQ